MAQPKRVFYKTGVIFKIFCVSLHRKTYFLPQKQNAMAAKDIITGQYVRIEQTPASIGERLFARIIDGVAIVVYAISLTYVLSSLPITTQFSNFFVVVFFLLAYSPMYAYSLLCEYFFDGRTVGKFIMGTRVVMADGSSPTLGALLLRWLAETVDIMMAGIGLLVIAVTHHHQRIGDLMAGTMVIKQPALTVMRLSLGEFSYASSHYHPRYPEAQNLSLGQAELLDRVLYGQAFYDNQRVRQLANKVCQVLQVRPKTDNPTAFLVDVLHDYQYYATQLV